MELDLATRTLFADFRETVFARHALEKKIKDTPTFAKKKVKNKVYWYEQRYEGGQARQTYFGPSSSANDHIVYERREALQKDKMLYKKLFHQEGRQAAMLKRGGIPMLDRRMAVIVERLSDSGLIDREGVLIGTLAYQSYSAMLGVVFEKNTLMTQDIDVVRDDNVEVAGAPILFDNLFSRQGISCRAVPTLSTKALPSSFVTSDGIRIDFLVPLRGKARPNVKMPNVVGAGATALRFLDFLIADPVRTVILSPTGGICVSVPSPERFAIHKLIVAAYRPVSESEKIKKDLLQAKYLIDVLVQERPRELKSIRAAACRNGKKWEKAILSSEEKAEIVF